MLALKCKIVLCIGLERRILLYFGAGLYFHRRLIEVRGALGFYLATFYRCFSWRWGCQRCKLWWKRLQWESSLRYNRDGWPQRDGSFFGKVPNGLWPSAPSFSENHVEIVFKFHVQKPHSKVQNLQHKCFDWKWPTPLRKFSENTSVLLGPPVPYDDDDDRGDVEAGVKYPFDNHAAGVWDTEQLAEPIYSKHPIYPKSIWYINHQPRFHQIYVSSMQSQRLDNKHIHPLYPH